MKDHILTTLLREWLEANPPSGLEKLTNREMDNLSEALSEITFDVYQRGFDDGFDSSLETLKEGTRFLFGVEL